MSAEPLDAVLDAVEAAWVALHHVTREDVPEGLSYALGRAIEVVIEVRGTARSTFLVDRILEEATDG